MAGLQSRKGAAAASAHFAGLARGVVPAAAPAGGASAGGLAGAGAVGALGVMEKIREITTSRNEKNASAPKPARNDRPAAVRVMVLPGPLGPSRNRPTARPADMPSPMPIFEMMMSR